MNLESILIHNFQCHQETRIDLDPHVTVLIGQNGAGKSAVIRALAWAALNRWGGKADAFIHWGAENSRVDLVFQEGLTIGRQKGKAGNLYLLNGVVYEGDLSRSIPVEIKDLINMTEDNFHEQLDPAFWFSLTAGQVAKSLNKIVNLNGIDTSLGAVASRLRSARDTHKLVVTRLAEATNIKESLDWTKEADDELTAIEQQLQSLQETREKCIVLASKIHAMTQQTRIQQNAATVLADGKELIVKIDKINTIRAEIAKLAPAIKKVSTLAGVQSKAKPLILEGGRVVVLAAGVTRLQSEIKALTVHVNSINSTRTKLTKIQADLAVTRPRLVEAQANQCPLCGRE